MATNTIILLSADAAAAEPLRQPLIAVGREVMLAASVDEALAAAAGSPLLVMGALEPGRDAGDVCRTIRDTPELRALAICVITEMHDVETRVRLLESGADEVLVAPVDSRELEARVEALLLRAKRSAGSGAVPGPSEGTPRRHRSIAVFSPSGGVGTTTIAVNIALALTHQHPGRVVIVDLHYPFGQVATHLDLVPHQTIGQLARDDAALRDPALLETFTERHISGLRVIAAPGTWEPLGVLRPEGAQLLVDTATLAYDAVVIDAGSATDDRTIAVLQRVDSVVLAVCPEIAALRALHAFADSMAERGLNLEGAVFVLNHLFAREILKSRDIETALGRPPAIELPYDPVLYVKAVNEGVPILRSAPMSAAAHALTRLAHVAMEDTVPESPEVRAPHQKRSGGLLGGFIRRP